ncbi:MAG: PQQ-binding-like beta-propeller repeat protein [Planctomycetes bacterium]|nr:PQQ-binding-like beta-propeller repeat protein [Planctomycetota bacterium]
MLLWGIGARCGQTPEAQHGNTGLGESPHQKVPHESAAPPFQESAELYWPQWRGPLGIGVAPHADPPLEWSERENIRWKIPLPGKGHSTPVVWGDRVFITAAVPIGEAVPPPAGSRPGDHDNETAVRRQKFVVLAVHRRNGRVIWEKAVRENTPHEGGHETGSYASPSPVTDGERVYAFFGSQGLYCLDWSGDLVWEKDLGDMHTKHGHGEGSSPALYGDTLIVNWDHEGPSFVVALDKRTGTQRWKVDRDEVSSWSTPLVVKHNGRPQVIVSATRRVRGYDLGTGEVLWECGGLSHNVVASPVSADGLVLAGSSYEKRAMLAIRLEGAKGDITGTDHVAWSLDRHTPYVPSPLLYDGKLYFFKHYQGILSCLNAKTGQAEYGPVRLPGIRDVYASPVGAAGRVYITARDGVTLVIKHGTAIEVLAANRLDDVFNASPAMVGQDLFLRGERNLYCIAEN